VGYGAQPPDPQWPGGARLALSFVLNYEEGGEYTPLEGDAAAEAYLHEVVGAPATVGQRNLNVESMFEFGSRAGFWRVHRLFAGHGLPLTVYAVGQALERNPDAARAMIDAGWEVASHGWRWIDYANMPEDEEREHMRLAIAAIERVCGARPSAGTRAGRLGARAGSSSRRGASSTTPTPTQTSFPTGSTSAVSTTSLSRTRSTRTTSSS
jgi:allantoinase